MSATALQSSSPSDDVREIPLTRGQVAIVDAADYEWLSAYKWRAVRNGGYSRTFYAATGQVHSGGIVLMHNLVLPPEPGLEIDHRDRNGLNNRRKNLRQATRQQNCANRSTTRERPGYRGAYPRRGRWRAAIMVNGVQKSLGFYATEIEAARAYDRAATEMFGEFAVLNFPSDRDWLFPHEQSGCWPPRRVAGLRD